MVPRKNSNLWICFWMVLCALGWLWFLGMCLWISACSYSTEGRSEQEPLQVTFMDVGQGLGVLLEREGRHALYDTGPDSVGFVDSLLGRGVKTLDWVLVSHCHRDHGGGFLEMGSPMKSGHLKVKRLLFGPDTAPGFVCDSLLRMARQFDIPVDTLSRGDTVWFTDGVTLECLWPVNYGTFGENRASVVLKASLSAAEQGEQSTLLLTGDMDSVAESRLLELSSDLKVDLLQVAHHGSGGSSTLKFLAQVAPRYAVVSVGAGNSYGHPTSEVVQKLRYVLGDSASLFRTDLKGNVTFEMFPQKGGILLKDP